MKRGIKKKCGVYAYLESAKVLETGSDQDIAVARKAYWKVYKAEWRKKQRQEMREFTITFTHQEVENIAEAAKKHKRTRSNFIKESCLAYINRRYLVPDKLAISTIHQLLAINLNTLQKLFDENSMPFDIGRTMLSQMTELEQKVMHELYFPKQKDAEL